MEQSLRKKALENLARQDNPKVREALLSEHKKISGRLSSDDEYQNLSDQLEMLDSFAYRFPEESVETISSFLKRIEKIELQHKEIPGIRKDWFDRYQTPASLIIKALKVLEHIRYMDMEAILPVFLEYSLHDNNDVCRYAEKALREFAEYHLEIFYPKDGREGFGVEPQIRILNHIERLQPEEKEKYLSGIVSLCSAMLSPSIQGTSSNYKSFTITKAAVPAHDHVKDVRNRTLDVLESLYDSQKPDDVKSKIRQAMLAATHTYSHIYPGPPVGDSILDMIAENTTRILDFFHRILPYESLPTLQKIEHHAWMLNDHRERDAVHDRALRVKEALDNNAEYQIFKMLVGFEGVFEAWRSAHEEDENDNEPSRYEQEEALRNAKAIEYAGNINEANYAEWEQRIIEYGSIESNDMAMFPYFSKFLEHFGRVSPELALQLLASRPDIMMRHGSLARGIWETGKRQALRERLLAWAENEEYLPQILWWIIQLDTLDEELLRTCFAKAIQKKENDNLQFIVTAVITHYNDNHRYLVRDIFLPSVQALTDLKDGSWSRAFWWRDDRKALFVSLDGQEIDIVLDNIEFIPIYDPIYDIMCL